MKLSSYKGRNSILIIKNSKSAILSMLQNPFGDQCFRLCYWSSVIFYWLVETVVSCCGNNCWVEACQIDSTIVLVSIASFQAGKMKMLSHAFDMSLGGRDFDEVLFRHFAKKFKEHPFSLLYFFISYVNWPYFCYWEEGLYFQKG